MILAGLASFNFLFNHREELLQAFMAENALLFIKKRWLSLILVLGTVPKLLLTILLRLERLEAVWCVIEIPLNSLIDTRLKSIPIFTNLEKDGRSSLCGAVLKKHFTDFRSKANRLSFHHVSNERLARRAERWPDFQELLHLWNPKNTVMESQPPGRYHTYLLLLSLLGKSSRGNPHVKFI